MANEIIITPIGILSFPSLFVARSPAADAEERYSCNLILDRTAQERQEFKDLKIAVAKAIDEKWGSGKHRDRTFTKGVKLPWRSCADRNYNGYEVEGGVFIAPWTKIKPGVVDRLSKPILDAEEVWAGQTARCFVVPFAYQVTNNKGISLSLRHVQIIRTDTPRLDGRRTAEDEFARYPIPAEYLPTEPLSTGNGADKDRGKDVFDEIAF